MTVWSPPLDATAGDADQLRRRANRLRQVLRGLLDPRAVDEIERFIAELEAEADALGRK